MALDSRQRREAPPAPRRHGSPRDADDGFHDRAGGHSAWVGVATNGSVGATPRAVSTRHPAGVPPGLDCRRVWRAYRCHHPQAQRAWLLPDPSRRIEGPRVPARAVDDRSRLLRAGRDRQCPLLRRSRAPAVPVDSARLGAVLADRQAPTRHGQPPCTETPGQHARQQHPADLGGDQALRGDERAWTASASDRSAPRALRKKRRLGNRQRQEDCDGAGQEVTRLRLEVVGWLRRPYSHLTSSYDRALGVPFLFRTRRAFEHLVQRYGLRFRSAADLGCGTGLFACYLNRRWGVPVFAVDRSPEMLRVALENCRVPRVCFLRQDIRELCLPSPVDLITANFDALNHVLSSRELQDVFRRIRENLRPGGHL